MAQEQISKINTLAIVGGPAGSERISKLTIYAIVNNDTPVPPPVLRRRASLSVHYGAQT